MIIKIFSFTNDIEIGTSSVPTLLIENNKLYSNIVYSLNCNINGEKGVEDIKLIQDDDILSLSKEVILITDIISYDFNDRILINKLYKYIENQYKMDDDNRAELFKGIDKVINSIMNELCELPFEFKIKDDISVVDCLKMLGIKYDYDYSTSIKDKIYAFIDLMVTMKLTTLIVFVSIKRYLGVEEFQELVKYIKYKRVNILFIEQGINRNCVEGEIIYYIDKEYDEFILYHSK